MLQVKNLYKNYRENTILDDVNFDIKRGAIVGFVGNNCVGKTTIIKCILNEIKFLGSLIKDFNQLKNISLYPDLNNIPQNISVIEYIKYIAKINFIKNDIFNERMNSIFKILNIEELLKKIIKKLSSGQKKLVIMAGVLIKSPDLIIMDEPSSNLDVENRNMLFEIIKNLNKYGVTFLITSHILDELQNYINQLIILDNKKIVYNKEFNNLSDDIKLIYSKHVKSDFKDSIVNEKSIKGPYGKDK